MINLRQFLVAVSLTITGLAALAQTTSPNLVPLPNHWTTNGQSVVQSYAINQALALSGSDVRINGFDYGYQYNLGNSWTQCTAHNRDGSCSWTMTFNPRVDVNVSIRDNNNAQIYGTTHIETGANTGNRSRDFQYRFNDPRDILTLGNFNFTASTSPNATVFGMYSRANYSIVTTTNPTFSDDSYVHIPLQFGFPFYGRVFTNSWMHSNGVVSFLDPMSPIEGAGWNPGAGAYCCSGERPTVSSPQFSYMIAPLWTDLYPVGQSRFRTEGNGQYQRYYWENIAEISNMNNLSTFGVEIRPSGYIGSMYSNVNIQNQNTWIGTIGNPRLGEWNEIQFGSVINSANRANWSLPETVAADCSNPLLNPACPGYAQAYLTQQCSISPLFSNQCPGYQQAYFDQQCSLNSLYNVNCPGYATAYYDYQCSVNPLYHTGCPGYATAYLNYQCSLDALYSTTCSGYAEAYALKNIVNKPVATQEIITTSSEVSLVSDPVVNEKLTSTATSASPAAAATATVPLVPAPAAKLEAAAPKEEKKDDTKTSSSENKPSDSTASASSEKKDQPKTARQQLAERRQAAAKAAAIEKAKNADKEMDSATSMEAQVAVQNVVIQAMGYTPGFDAYNVRMPDGVGYKPFTVYNNQKNVDNARLMKGLTGGSDRVHAEMVDSQYRR